MRASACLRHLWYGRPPYGRPWMTPAKGSSGSQRDQRLPPLVVQRRGSCSMTSASVHQEHFWSPLAGVPESSGEKDVPLRSEVPHRQQCRFQSREACRQHVCPGTTQDSGVPVTEPGQTLSQVVERARREYRNPFPGKRYERSPSCPQAKGQVKDRLTGAPVGTEASPAQGAREPITEGPSTSLVPPPISRSAIDLKLASSLVTATAVTSLRRELDPNQLGARP